MHVKCKHKFDACIASDHKKVRQQIQKLASKCILSVNSHFTKYIEKQNLTKVRICKQLTMFYQ